jgi:hypothetical protein
MPDEQIAESSPAEAQEQAPAARPSLESLSTSERDHWRMTGELPGAKQDQQDTSTDAAATAAEPADQAASTDATPPPASEPGKPAKKAKNADTRVQELLAERHQLQQRLEAYERGGQPPAPQPDANQAASSPATADADTFPDFDTWAAEPANEGKSYETYTRALVRYELEQEQQQIQHVTAIRARGEAFGQRFEAAKAADPSFVASLSDDVLRMQPIDGLPPGVPVRPINLVAQEIIQSEQATSLLRHFSEHPDELRALEGASPSAIVRAITRLESKYEGQAGSSPAATTPPRSQITKAPEPPPTLGSRPAAPANEAEAALARGDFAAYRDAMNRQEMAEARG